MTEYLKDNPIALRTCVIYESLRSRQECKPLSSFSAYQNFCKAIGEDVMEYREFDFWFHRFLNGELDLNIGMDKDKKIYKLMDMPIVVMEKIAENLDFFDRLALQRTSRSLRTFIKHQKLFVHIVEFDVQNNMACIRLDKKTSLEYINQKYDCVRLFCGRRKFIENVQYWQQVIQDFKQILEYPNLYLDTLQANFVWGDRVFQEAAAYLIVSTMLLELYPPTHQLHLKKLDARVVYVETLSKLLPYFKPGYLTTIVSKTSRPNKDYELKELVELEQWKQAKYFSTKGTLFVGPMRHLYHFKEFYVRLENLSVKDIREMKEILFKSPDFEKCSLALNNRVDIGQEFGDAIPGTTNIYHYPIPDSNQYFEIGVEEKKIEILRKKE